MVDGRVVIDRLIGDRAGNRWWLSPGDLEHRAVAVRATDWRRAEQVSGCVGDEAGYGFGAVGSVEAE